MIKREEDGVWIELTETIAAHHDLVFDCLTTADGLTRWFPVAARVELRKGGLVVLSWNKDFTRTTTIAILDYDTNGRITWDWHAGSLDTHSPLYWKVEPDVEQGSVVTVRQGPFGEDVESLLAMAEEAESWRWRLCNLRSSLEVEHDMRKIRPL